jgi:hypothetical protein
MMEAERSAYRKKLRVFPIRQQNPRPLDPARRFGSRLRYRPQPLHIRISERQLNRPPPGCHRPSILCPQCTPHTYRSLKRQMNPSLMTTFTESIV